MSAVSAEVHERCLDSYRRILPDPAVHVVAKSAEQTVAPTSPLTNLSTPEIPRANAEDVRGSVARAREAAQKWAKVPPRERAGLLLRIHDEMWKWRDQLLDVIQWESGKTRLQAFDEVQDFALTTRYYGRTAEKTLAPKRRRGAIPVLTQTEERFHPKGVVGIISPWNYPLTLSASDALSALVAGNAVVLKPDSSTPHTAIAIRAIMVRAGLPADLFQIVCGSGSELGNPLIDSVDYLMFTGSSKTGRKVAARAAQNLIGCSAELGGKNPMIIMEDADLQAAVRGAIRGCFTCAGQLCISIERLYVQRSIYEPFRAAFIEATQDMRLSANLQWDTDMGVLISPEHLEKVEGHVRDAVEKGARVLTGGVPRPDIAPTGFAPTILENVGGGMELYREETFGPVVSLYPFDTAEEAIALANDTIYGLNASVYSTPARGRKIAREIRAGTVNVNEAFAATWGSMEAPMGGMGASGIGRRHGPDGLIKYTEPQTIATQHLVPLTSPKREWNEKWANTFSVLLKAMRWSGLK